MAITKILNIKESEGRNPASHLKNALEYIQNPDKTEECVLVGGTDAKDEQGNLLPDEVRLTKFGKALRSTSLDELPELFNILKGDCFFYKILCDNFMVVICIYQNAVRILKCRKCGHFVSDRAAHCLYLFICVQLSFCENLLSNVFF